MNHLRKNKQIWMKQAQWTVGKVRITIEIPFDWHKTHRNCSRGRVAKPRRGMLAFGRQEVI